MNSKEIRQQADKLIEAKGKIREAMEEASAVFEKTIRTLYAGGDDRRREILEGLLEGLEATIKELRNAEKEIDQQACVLYYEASRAANAEAE